jgi:long-chain acyl-CoA synthetase
MSDNLVSRFQQLADRHPADPLWHEHTGGAWRPTTWSQARAWVEEIAAGLISLGIEKADRVGLVGANQPAWVASDYGIQHSAAVPVPLYNTLSTEQISYVLGHSGARALIVDSQEQLDKALASNIPDVGKIIAHHLGDADRGRVIGTDRLREMGRQWAADHVGQLRARMESVVQEDTFSVIYTSGTTGPPKGTVLTHANAVKTVDATLDRLGLDGPVEIVISYLPLSHVFERLLTAAAGLSLDENRFEYYFVPELPMLPDALKEARPTFFVGVPRVWEKFEARIRAEVEEAPAARQRLFNWAAAAGAEACRVRDDGGKLSIGNRLGALLAERVVGKKVFGELGLDRCAYAVSGAAPLAGSVQRFFQGLGLDLHQGWGMTETSAACTVQERSNLHVGSVGRPLDGVEMELAEDGEVMVRGINIFSGYYDEPEQTAEALTSDGWLSTGDIGAVMDDGSLRIVDRKKDIIITAGGKNIAPQELEARLKANSLVGEAIVIGDQRPYLVSLISLDADEAKAFLHHHGIESATDAEIYKNPSVLEVVERTVADVNATFSRAEGIRRWSIVEGGFPAEAMTPTLKLKRRVVNEVFEAEVEALYS